MYVTSIVSMWYSAIFYHVFRHGVNYSGQATGKRYHMQLRLHPLLKLVAMI